jgi:hypothetical protein
MDNSLTMGIACLVGAVVAKVGKAMSEDLMKKISASDRWPLDDWEIAVLGLGYERAMNLTRDEFLKRTKSSISMQNILSWIFFGAASFFFVIWLL